MVKQLIISMFLVVAAGTAWANQDPTAPFDWQAPATDSSATPQVKQYPVPTLNSIICKPNARCIAILNNHIVEQGERVEGYRVARITSDFVTLKRGNRVWELELFGLNVKK
ncbi:MSHA biogenesis protein MshK [Vibrio mytili]|uniref:MSHA biogenesis protein MshK n=1 Tax=Vibrio mytili TaxID=50718 RepID=UPI003C6F98F2